MTTEERLEGIDFPQLSKIKDSLLLRLKLRRRVINEEKANGAMSLEELDEVNAAGNPHLRIFDEKKKIETSLLNSAGFFFDMSAKRL